MMNLEFLLPRLATYWNERSVLFKPDVELSENLPNVTEFIDYFSSRFISESWIQSISVPINASRIDKDRQLQQFFNVDINSARNLYSQGYSLCFGDLSGWISSIADLKQNASEVFFYPESIVVTAYLSPPNSVGVLHYDRQHNYFIQKSGEKRWFVSQKPGLVNPHENLIYSDLSVVDVEAMQENGCPILLPKDCGIDEYNLSEGHVLYLPPGFYHSPETLSQPSLHYTLTIEPVCVWKDIQTALDTLLTSSDRSFYRDYRMLDSETRLKMKEHCMKMIKGLT